MENQTKINLDEELNKAKQTNNRWKAAEGTHQIEFVEEPVPDVYVDKDGKVSQQVRLHIRINGVGQYYWNIPRSTSSLGLWIQLCNWAKSRGGKFIDGMVKIKVMGVDKNKRYTVLD